MLWWGMNIRGSSCMQLKTFTLQVDFLGLSEMPAWIFPENRLGISISSFSCPWRRHVWITPQHSASQPTSFLLSLSHTDFPRNPRCLPHHGGLPAFSRDFTSQGKGCLEADLLLKKRWRNFWRKVQFGKGKAHLVTLVAKSLVSVLVLLVDCFCYCLSSTGKCFE